MQLLTHTSIVCGQRAWNQAKSWCYWSRQFFIFTALHGMQMRSSNENSVCLSVCQAHDLWQNERKLCMHSYTTRKTIYLSFMRRRMAWNFGSTGPRWSEIADFELIFAHSVSAVTPNEKSSINTNRKSGFVCDSWPTCPDCFLNLV